METVYTDYAPQGVQFYYLYKSLAHPGLYGYVSPFTLQERLMQVRDAEQKLGSKIQWMCDGMSNDAKHTLGEAPNGEFVIDPDGIVVRRRAWSSPEALRRDLEELVGPVEKRTRVSDLKMNVNVEPPSGEIPTRIVPGVDLPGRMTPLRIEPVTGEKETPFYVKLRVDADRSFLETGTGKLYLGFHLDRLYKVHWNNLTKPLEFEIESPAGVVITPSTAAAPEVEAEADRDPREFLLDIAAQDKASPLDLTVRYFACDDANTFCVPVTQQYAIHLQRDRDGGRPARRRQRGRGRPDFTSRLREADRDGDGKLSIEEAPEPLRRRFSSIDSDGDGLLDEEELRAMRRQGRGGPGGRRFWQRILENDANGDGKVSREEAPPQLQRRFDRIDGNGDGLIDEEELQAMFRRLGPRGGRLQ